MKKPECCVVLSLKSVSSTRQCAILYAHQYCLSHCCPDSRSIMLQITVEQIADTLHRLTTFSMASDGIGKVVGEGCLHPGSGCELAYELLLMPRSARRSVFFLGKQKREGFCQRPALAFRQGLHLPSFGLFPRAGGKTRKGKVKAKTIVKAKNKAKI